MKKTETILLAHGSGGTMMRDLIEGVFVDVFADVQLEDAATLDIPAGKLAFSTDTFVVSPLFFPGGDIGHLAVCGTVNDVATAGATPLYLSVGFILEEGFPLDDLKKILTSMAECAQEAGVKIVTGDTKVVGKGAADGIFINTAGVGVVRDGVSLRASNCQVGDKILLSGTLGDHGITIVSQREGMGFGTTLETDAAPLNHLIDAVLDVAPGTRVFRDPTRGGLASCLNEIADASKVSMLVIEDEVPIHQQVRGACEMLGYDVFQVANEGKMVAIVPADQATAALEAMRNTPYGAEAAIVGEVVEGTPGRVNLRNGFGATRIMDTLVGEQLPRIC
jgi:hydrogenase expression/formation protein HypE